MQKFRRYIYCNYEMLNDFIGQIKELSTFIKETDQQKSSLINGSGGIGVAKIESEISESTKTVFESRISDVEQFISWCAIPGNSININKNIPNVDDKGVICILNGKAYLPDKVSDFQILESLKDNIEMMASVPGIKAEDVQQAQLLKNSSCIPILIDTVDNYVVNGLITKKHLKEDINDFLESIDDEITIIGRIDNMYFTGEVEIFDIAKECLKVSRTVRRRMNPERLKDIIVYEETPLIKITPLIIYK